MSNIIPKISTHADLICAENLIAVCDEQTTNDDYCRVMNHEQRHVQMQRRSSAEPSKESPDGPPDGFARTVRDPAIDRRVILGRVENVESNLSKDRGGGSTLPPAR